MDGVKLELNPEKTEFITIRDDMPESLLCKNFKPSFLEILSPLPMKNLGVTFDSGNTFASNITKVYYACYYHLKDLRRIWKFLSVETAALLANSMISSLNDYYNFPLYGLNKYNMAKLQKIQISLCRSVFRLDKTSHVTPCLQKLH